MNHKEFQEKIFLIHDKDLPTHESQEIKSHLQVCSQCKTELGNWEKLAGLLHIQIEEDPLFVRKVMSKIYAFKSQEEQKKREAFLPKMRSYFWQVPALVFSLILILLAIAPSFKQNEHGSIVETLLLADAKEDVSSRWMFNSKTPNDDEILGLSLEKP